MAHKMSHAPPAKAGGKPTKADLTQVPIDHLDLEKVRNLVDLLDGYARISFQARTLGACAQVLERMMLDPQATVYFGGAGAPLPRGLREGLRGLVELRLVGVMGTTGAIAYHDLYEAHRDKHYMSSPGAGGILLREDMPQPPHGTP